MCGHANLDNYVYIHDGTCIETLEYATHVLHKEPYSTLTGGEGAVVSFTSSSCSVDCLCMFHCIAFCYSVLLFKFNVLLSLWECYGDRNKSLYKCTRALWRRREGERDCVCVCVCERERKRGRGREKEQYIKDMLVGALHFSLSNLRA